jgi:hypothetical protein
MRSDPGQPSKQEVQLRSGPPSDHWSSADESGPTAGSFTYFPEPRTGYGCPTRRRHVTGCRAVESKVPQRGRALSEKSGRTRALACLDAPGRAGALRWRLQSEVHLIRSEGDIPVTP